MKIRMGRIVMTKGIKLVIQADKSFQDFVNECLIRHRRGDWGDISDDDIQANMESLPERAWKDHKWWCTRMEHGALFAIESGDFSKVSLDMDDHTVIVTRTCCIHDPGRMNVREESLRIKEHMKP